MTKGVPAESYQVLNELADILAENDYAQSGELPKLTKGYVQPQRLEDRALERGM